MRSIFTTVKHLGVRSVAQRLDNAEKISSSTHKYLCRNTNLGIIRGYSQNEQPC